MRFSTSLIFSVLEEFRSYLQVVQGASVMIFSMAIIADLKVFHRSLQIIPHSLSYCSSMIFVSNPGYFH